MKTIPREVLAAAKVIAGRGGMFTPEYVLSGDEFCEDAIRLAIASLNEYRHPRTDSRWLQLNSAAQVMREFWEGKE